LQRINAHKYKIILLQFLFFLINLENNIDKIVKEKYVYMSFRFYRGISASSLSVKPWLILFFKVPKSKKPKKIQLASTSHTLQSKER
jgi:hypothetical protein